MRMPLRFALSQNGFFLRLILTVVLAQPLPAFAGSGQQSEISNALWDANEEVVIGSGDTFQVTSSTDTLPPTSNYATPYTFSFLNTDPSSGFSVLAVDASHNVYVADVNGISEFNPTGFNLNQIFDSRLSSPSAMAVDQSGNIYTVGNGGQTVYEVDPQFSGVTTFEDLSGRGYTLSAIVVDGSGDVFVLDSAHDVIREITPQKVVSVFASGLGAKGLAIDKNNIIYVTTNTQILMITPGKVVSTLAGVQGVTGFNDGAGATAQFNGPTQLGVDTNGNVYVNDTGNDTLREVSPAGVVTTLAGVPDVVATGPSIGSGANVLFNENGPSPELAVTGGGKVYLLDSNSGQIIYGGIPASVTIVGGSVNYNGSAQSDTATTVPTHANGTSLNVVFEYESEEIYNGEDFESWDEPYAVFAGFYTVNAAIDDGNYVGTATAPAFDANDFEINEFQQTITSIVLSGPVVIGGSPVQLSIIGNVQAGFPLDFSFDSFDSVYEVDKTDPNTGHTIVVATLTGDDHATLTVFSSGAYSLFATVGGDPNYNGATSAGQAGVDSNGAVILGNLNFTYNGAPQPATATPDPTSSGNTPITVNFVYTVKGVSTNTAPTAAGSYPVTATMVDPTNTFSGSQTGTLTIAPEPITVAVNAGGTSASGATPSDPGISLISGTLYGDTLASLGFGDSINLLNSSTPAGNYTINVTGPTSADAANYNITTQSATYVITVVSNDTSTGSGALNVAMTTGTDDTADGFNALSVSTGAGNTGVGAFALTANAGGAFNTAVGAYALADNVSGTGNAATGAYALNMNTTGAGNTANGYAANLNNTTGANNSATGVVALLDNATGANNTADGANALLTNNGSNNTATGADALNLNTTGADNTASGYAAALYNTTGSDNTATGFVALLGNTTGFNNTATGASALYSNTTGANNTANGAYALNLNTTGADNTASGYAANLNNTTGANNTATGVAALLDNTTGSNNTATGIDALLTNNGSDNTANGASVLYANTSGSNNTANGFNALLNNTSGAANSANGAQALAANTTGYANTANGAAALVSNTSGYDNTADGYAALNASTGSENTAEGFAALYSNTGAANAANGYEALYANTGGYANTASGAMALVSNTIGYDNTATGYAALFSSIGSENTGDGFNALGNDYTGQANTALGYQAGSKVTSGSLNIEIGNAGASADARTIRLGTPGTQSQTFIAGISGTPLTGVEVVVTSTGQLGTMGSSERFKKNIHDMGHASEALLSLRPVTFQYKPEIDPTGAPQFGLIAEEVEKVNPDLVIHDANHQIYTVRYEAVNAMLLNECQKQHETISSQQKTIAQQQQTLAAQQKALADQKALLQKVAARLDLAEKAMSNDK